tara:strand:- start:87 stop:560 length:474 start_codon:yes stop_codon:yes gene_type:complete
VSRFLGFFLLLNTLFYAQNDTIVLLDTILSSVKVLSVDDFNLEYLDSHQKKIDRIALEQVKGVIYEHQKIEIFCDLMSSKKFLGTEEALTINYGDRDSLWLDKSMYNKISKQIKKYNSIIDALNYMGSEGWETLRSYSTSHNSYTVEHYVLKKEIIK